MSGPDGKAATPAKAHDRNLATAVGNQHVDCCSDIQHCLVEIGGEHHVAPRQSIIERDYGARFLPVKQGWNGNIVAKVTIARGQTFELVGYAKDLLQDDQTTAWDAGGVLYPAVKFVSVFSG
ncbi:MAG: hypothetical protein P1V21_08720 [Rhizobiaceae bacterium]|nr:hypothetical protein [Rhizobiaceae bacterium]